LDKWIREPALLSREAVGGEEKGKRGEGEIETTVNEQEKEIRVWL